MTPRYPNIPTYTSKEWYRLRARQLRREPWCRYCAQLGLREKGTHVDHIQPHRGNLQLWQDPANLQTLCAMHHNAVKLREETSGKVMGANTDGTPIDPNHHWNKS